MDCPRLEVRTRENFYLMPSQGHDHMKLLRLRYSFFRTVLVASLQAATRMAIRPRAAVERRVFLLTGGGGSDDARLGRAGLAVPTVGQHPITGASVSLSDNERQYEEQGSCQPQVREYI